MYLIIFLLLIRLMLIWLLEQPKNQEGRGNIFPPQHLLFEPTSQAGEFVGHQ